MKAIKNKNSIFYSGNYNKWVQVLSYYVHYYNNFDMVFHSHDRTEIMYVSSGECIVEYQDINNKGEIKITKNTISPNSYVFIDANLPHKICIDNVATQIYNIEFGIIDAPNNVSINKIINSNSLASGFFSQTKPIFFIQDDGILLQHLILIQKYIGKEINTKKDIYLNYLLSSFLLLIAKQFSQINKVISGISYINKATNFIYENYNKKITLHDISAVCEISPNYLNALFVSNFEKTVINYLNFYRIKRSAHLLTTTNIPIDEIRTLIGYNNKVSFHQNFLRFMNTTPGKYRQKTQSSNVVESHENGGDNNYFIE